MNSLIVCDRYNSYISLHLKYVEFIIRPDYKLNIFGS